MLWKTGAGGRADAVIVPLGKNGTAVHASECWDKAGLRTGYLDDIAANDKDNPNAGDVTGCLQIARDMPDDTAPSDSGVDADPEVTAELAAAGADITEADADMALGDDL